MSRWLWLAVGSIVACGPSRNAPKQDAPAPALATLLDAGMSPPPSTASANPPPSAAASTAPSAAPVIDSAPPPSAASLFHVAEQTGPCALAPPDSIGQRLSTGADGRLSFDLPNGTRVHLDPDSQAWVLAFEPSALAIVSGSALIDLPPQGKPAGAVPLRVITPHGSLSVPNLAELFVAARITGSKPAAPLASGSYFAILRGSAELARFANDVVEISTVLAGQTSQSGGAVAPVQTIALEGARRSAGEWLRRKDSARPSLDVDARLERVLSQLAEERKRGGELVARVVPANAASIVHVTPRPGSEPTPASGQAQPSALGSVAEARAYERALVGHAQRQLLTRQALRLATEQSLVATLARCAAEHDPSTNCGALASWRTRFLARVSAGL